MSRQDVINHILENWKTTVRTPDDVIHGSIRIPYCFTVPCAKEAFTDFYYWDTYFTNIGLLLSGWVDQVRSNLDTMKFFVDTLGFVPNANHIVDRSQPPLFTRGVFDLYTYTGDKAVILRYADALLKEHEFFETKRKNPIGLSQYSTAMTDEELAGSIGICDRVQEPIPENREEVIRLSRNIFAIAESGWDFNPRFNTKDGRFRTDEFIHLDLNALLYDEEKKLAFLLREIGRAEDADALDLAAARRKALMEKYLLDPADGIYKDYNFVTGEFSKITSVASLYVYCMGISDDKVGAQEVLRRLELPFGLATCAPHPQDPYLQWDYPAMWPPTTYFAVLGLENAGLTEEARRIAEKFLNTATNIFENTGSLWEKYDAENGQISVTNEYETPKMLGWTAGVYLFLNEKYGNP